MRFLNHLKSPFAKRIVLALCIAVSAVALLPDNVVFGDDKPSVRMGGAHQDGTQIRYSVCISPVLKPAPTPTPDRQVRGGVIVFDSTEDGSAAALIAFVFRAGDSCKSGSYGLDQDDGNRTIRIEVNHVFDTYSVGSPSSESVSYKIDDPPPTPIPSPTPIPTPIPPPPPTPTPTPIPTPTPTATPLLSPTPIPTPSPVPPPPPPPTPPPRPTPTPVPPPPPPPTPVPTPTPIPPPPPTPTPTPTPAPTPTPTQTLKAVPTVAPIATPRAETVATPTAETGAASAAESAAASTTGPAEQATVEPEFSLRDATWTCLLSPW